MHFWTLYLHEFFSPPQVIPEGRSRRMLNAGGCITACACYTGKRYREKLGRYHSDIQRIYIPHDRSLASSDSRTTGLVKRFSEIQPCIRCNFLLNVLAS